MSNRFETIQRDLWKINLEVNVGGALRKELSYHVAFGGRVSNPSNATMFSPQKHTHVHTYFHLTS